MENYSSKKYLNKLDGYWRAANYLSVAQLYLKDNPLLRDHELCTADIKKKLVGHWGTVPGQNFVYAHCNRVINKYNLNMILLSGPGHGGNFLTANSYLEGVYSKYYPNVSLDREGMKKLCKQFSFPGGIGSHAVPETPGSIHEGGELGYSVAHAYGAVLDNPNLIATVIVGDGEAETGPLATSWHANKFIDPTCDGAVLPILHLNGYKINNPTVLSRISKIELTKLFEGYGYTPYYVEGNNPLKMHSLMAQTMDKCIEQIQNIQFLARSGKLSERKPMPIIILRTPKGWTGPKEVDGVKIENYFKAHQIPIAMNKEEHLNILKDWLLSYKPNELFDKNYKLKAEYLSIVPEGDKRITANPYANGGKLLKELITPNINDCEVKFKGHGTVKAQDMNELGGYIRDLFKLNAEHKNYRIFSPDEAMSNRLYKAFEVENRAFNATLLPTDDKLAPNGRIMDAYLSEHLCEGMLEGYLLTGRHGMFNSYEAFIRVVDSMVAQHAKWLKCCNNINWRAPISSLNLILTSNVWQQDHNGFTHQDPGFIDHMVTKNIEVARVYLPPDANCLINCYDYVTKSKNNINIIVASKHPSYQWLNMKEAKEHCKKGIGEWKWAGINNTEKPDIVIASCGDTATLEALATITLIKEHLPNLNVKFINVVDLMKLVPDYAHSHGLSDKEYNKLFTKNTPIIFNYHGYPQLIHQLTYKRHNQELHVSGYIEEGTITTPFNMRVINKIDRFHLLEKVLTYVKVPNTTKNKLINLINNKLKEHKAYIEENGVDLPEIENWQWK